MTPPEMAIERTRELLESKEPVSLETLLRRVLENQIILLKVAKITVMW